MIMAISPEGIFVISGGVTNVVGAGVNCATRTSDGVMTR
jgi:hypothetical protein